MLKRCFSIVCAIAFWGVCPVQAAVQVTIATYYDYAPWIYPHETYRTQNNISRFPGLTVLLCKRLTEMAHGRFVFVAEYIPRKRIDFMLQTNQLSVVAWANPRPFNDAELKQYDWTAPLLDEPTYILSAKNNPLEYENLNSLIGKRFSSVLGHKYADLNSMIEAGKIIRDDANSTESAIKKLTADRHVDFALAERSALMAAERDGRLDLNKFYLAPTPLRAHFNRHILIAKGYPELSEFIKNAVTQLRTDSAWIQELNHYGLKPAPAL
ncbi:substrate-binding periplasmic protein [Chitinibacter sp. S2-10]|uniref:substrate-binding periplasmic protein n=1 Tax=Chitinibacter sp. S2-10 TaxID=3373597 RepID=UPI0039778AEC